MTVWVCWRILSPHVHTFTTRRGKKVGNGVQASPRQIHRGWQLEMQSCLSEGGKFSPQGMEKAPCLHKLLASIVPLRWSGDWCLF